MNSLSEEGLSKVTVWEDQYFINGIESGALLVKVIIRESDIDTNATIRNVRNKLSSLEKYLPTVGHDITKFNIYVKNLVSELASRGQVTQDLLINLLKVTPRLQIITSRSTSNSKEINTTRGKTSMLTN